jgi:hypothetical protein
LKGSTVKEVNVCCRQNNFTVIAWSMFSQRKTELSMKEMHGITTWWRGDGATWQRIDEATRQRSNAATDLTRRRGNGATRQRIDEATRQRSNAATEQRGNGLTWRRIDEATRQRSNAATDLLNENLSKCRMPKKIGVDWPRPSQFRKNSSESKCWNRKIGVDRFRESQKGPLQRQVSLIFFRTGHPGVAKAFCTSMACPWQEV